MRTLILASASGIDALGLLCRTGCQLSSIIMAKAAARKTDAALAPASPASPAPPPSATLVVISPFSRAAVLPTGGEMTTRTQESANGITTALLVLSTALLPLGLFLPALETTQFAFWRGEHSIIGVGVSLLEGEEYLLAGAVWAFSVIFPTAKLVWMWRLNHRAGPIPRSTIRRLEWFGKWSMGDVFIIALIVFSARSNSILDVSIAPGLIAFSLSVILAMLASGRIARREAQPPD